MSKYSKEELSSRINDLEIDEDLKVSLMEDISDSISDESEEINRLREELDTKKQEYDELHDKYKSRFMESNSTSREEKEDFKDYDEKNYIDIREI